MEETMKLFAMTILPFFLVSGLASAQVGSVTGEVTGQVRGTVDSAARLDSALDATSHVLVDSRTGLALDAGLISRLDSRLQSHSMTHADARLRSALESNARAYSRTRIHARAETPGVRTRGYGATSVRTHRRARHYDGHARVYVYTYDGYRVGYVNRVRSNGRVYVRSDIDTDTTVKAVAASNASFNSDANAVVLAMTRADFAGMAAVRR